MVERCDKGPVGISGICCRISELVRAMLGDWYLGFLYQRIERKYL